jgi:hypothetical protein
MPSYIETLEKIVVRMSKELEQEKSRVAELEKERDVLKIALDNCMTVEQMKIRDIEQQAKGVEDAANDYSNNLDATTVYLADLDDRVIELRNQAKALKEQE